MRLWHTSESGSDTARFGRPVLTEQDAARTVFRSAQCATRRRVLKDTLHVLAPSSGRAGVRALATANLRRAALNRRPRTAGVVVDVLPDDWGVVTGMATRTYGTMFAVLNMASPVKPGGAYVEGAPAQEENMFRRTDCHFSVTSDTYDRVLDEYHPAARALVEARNGTVFLDTETPRVCLRGPEDRTDPNLGYAWLAPQETFPFLELRSAAVDRRDGEPFDEVTMRARINAQFFTLADAGIRHVVLGAFGCGAFNNPAGRVAGLYAEMITKYQADFDVVLFAVHHAGYGPDNYTPFKTALT